MHALAKLLALAGLAVSSSELVAGASPSRPFHGRHRWAVTTGGDYPAVRSGECCPPVTAPRVPLRVELQHLLPAQRLTRASTPLVGYGTATDPAASTPTRARRERGVLVVEVRDVLKQPVAGVSVTAGPGGTVVRTDAWGRARVRLDVATQPGMVVPLRIKAPPGRPLAVLSPLDEQARVPPWENEAQNFVTVYVVDPATRQALESGLFVRLVLEQIKREATREQGGVATIGPQSEVSLDAARAKVATAVGLPVAALDSAVRRWAGRTTDPYERGLAAYYASRYQEAADAFRASLTAHRLARAAEDTAVYRSAIGTGDAAYALGQYRPAADAYREALALRPDDLVALTGLGGASRAAGDLAEADTLLVHALAVGARSLGFAHPQVAVVMDHLGLVRQDRGDLAGADTLYQRALAILTDALGPDHLKVAFVRNNLGMVRHERGDLVGADTLYQGALATTARTLGSDHPTTATIRSNLGLVRQDRGDLAGADTLFARALATSTRTVGPDHPTTAKVLVNLAGVRQERGDLAGADTLLARALVVFRRTLGPDHPATAKVLSNLAVVRESRGDLAGADTLYRRALAITEHALGPDHAEVARVLDLLAQFVEARGDRVGADSLYTRAVAIRERALGPEHPDTRATRERLAALRARSPAAPPELTRRPG